jgi:hypothetical protein
VVAVAMEELELEASEWICEVTGRCAWFERQLAEQPNPPYLSSSELVKPH